jgi:para-nitrobenzyl esterase
MPAARGLFRRGIQQSGVGRASTAEAANRIAGTILELLDLDHKRAAALLTLPAEAIVRAQGGILQKLGAAIRLGPVLDAEILPELPPQAIANGAAKAIEIVIGTNRDEAKLFDAMGPRDPIDDGALCKAACAVLPKAGEGEVRELISVYRASRKARGLPHDNLDIIDAINSDVRFRIPSLRWALGQRAAGGKAWVYLFTHPSPARRGALGSCHALEIAFVLGTLDAPGQGKFVGTGAAVERLSSEMMDAWLGFATKGEPATAEIGAWPQYEADNRPTMVFDTDRSGQDNDPLREERQSIEALMK